MAIVDVKISLRRRDADSYAVELSSTQPDSDAEVLSLEPGVARFDRGGLLQLQDDPAAYGASLAAALFAGRIRDDFASARAVAESNELPLRLRLQIDAGCPELHELRWETLRDPAGDRSLLLGPNLRFSRYLASADWRRVKLRPKAALRALVAVAAPAGLDAYGLAQLNHEAELARARAALGAIPVTALAAAGQATLANIIAALRDGRDGQHEFDIFYLVAHGAMVEGEPWLFLENADGAIERVPGAELAQRISGELPVTPRLVVLASCESAGSAGRTADGTPLTALGPRLASYGVPAVIAMQGQISLDTAAAFTAAFFEQLAKYGEIDRAVAVARGEIRNAPDAWMPVLFMRLRSGQIWYEPGFTGEKPMEKWPALLARLYDGKCTPILGEQLDDVILGPATELAHGWAREYGFPLAPHQQGELPHVAQFLSVHQDPEYPRDALIRATRKAILDEYGPALPKALATPRAPLLKLFTEVSRIRRESNLPDPHEVLAALPCAIYVTVAADTLMEEALTAAGKEPRSEICRWNDDLVANVVSVFDEGDYEPNEQEPLVFHLFGAITEPASLVLTEDNYFDFLIGATRNRDMIPVAVREALADSALLFLGFRLEDWSFRVLYRSLMSAQGGKRLKRYANIAGQVLPEESQFLAPQGAARYLEGYFKDSNINIFWGSVTDFTTELGPRWREYEQKQGG